MPRARGASTSPCVVSVSLPVVVAQVMDSDWTTLSKQQLEDEYSPRLWSKRGAGDWVLDQHIKFATEKSAITKETVPCEADVPYGEGAGEKFDLFGAPDLPADAPVFVYIHGGYWQALDRNISSYCVPPLYKAGNIVAIVGYDLAPSVTFDQIVTEIQSAVSAILKWAAERGSRMVVVGGHSAGSHLTAMLLHSDWCQREPNFHLIRALVHISGVFDLTPLVPTYVNDPLKLDEDEAKVFSPLHQLHLLQQSENLRRIRQLVVVGEHDSNEFKRQTREYTQALLDAGYLVQTEVVSGVDHFDIVEKLAEDDYRLTRQIVHMLSS